MMQSTDSVNGSVLCAFYKRRILCTDGMEINES